MDVAAIRSGAPAPHAPEPAVPGDPALKREVVQAIKALNGAEMFGQENELVYDMDLKAPRRIVVRG